MEHYNTFSSDDTLEEQLSYYFFKNGGDFGNMRGWQENNLPRQPEVVNTRPLTSTKQQYEKAQEVLLTELMEAGQFEGGTQQEVHALETFASHNVNMNAPSRPTNAMQFMYDDDAEICNLFSNPGFQNSMIGIFEQSEMDKVLTNKSASKASLRESFSNTSAITENCNLTNANCGLALPVNGNTQRSTPSTITSTQNDLALFQTPASMGGNEVCPPSDNKIVGVNQAIGQDKTKAAKTVLKRASTRTSQYRGVTRHRWTGRYEAHLWDNGFVNAGHKRKGKQVYLGGYDTEYKAARAYDKAAIKYFGDQSTTNFPVTEYKEDLEIMKKMTTVDYINYLKRKSSGFTRGASRFRGVTRHHQKGKWQARIGRINGNKDVYLGTYSTEEEAALTYDIATIKIRGIDSVTNFDKRFYNVAKINSSTLPIGELINYIKETGLNDVNEMFGTAPRIEEGNRMNSLRSATSYGNKASESQTVHQQQQRNPLTSVSHSGLWYKPVDDIQAFPNIYHSHLGQSMLTSSDQAAPQFVSGLGHGITNEGNNMGSVSGIYNTNFSDVLAANGLVLSNSSVVFAKPSNHFATKNIQALPMGNDSNRLVTANFEGNDFLARNATHLATQQFTGPGRLENQNVTHNGWIVEPLQSMPPQTNLSNGHTFICPPTWNSRNNSAQNGVIYT